MVKSVIQINSGIMIIVDASGKHIIMCKSISDNVQKFSDYCTCNEIINAEETKTVTANFLMKKCNL